MRLRACLGIVALGLGACAHLPEMVRIEIDGTSVEFKKEPAPPVPPSAPADAPEG